MQGKFVWSINEFVLKICFQRFSQNKPFDQKWSHFFEVQILLTSQVQDRIFRSSLFWKYVFGECSIHLIKWAFWPNIVKLFSKYKYLLLTKFEVKFFARIFCPTGKRKKRGFFFFTVQTEKMSLVRYLLHLWVQIEGRVATQTNFWIQEANQWNTSYLISISL